MGLENLKNLSPKLFNDRIDSVYAKEPIKNQHPNSEHHMGVGEMENPQQNSFVFNYPKSYIPEQGGLHKRTYDDQIKKMTEYFNVTSSPFGFQPAVNFFNSAFGDPNNPATPWVLQPFYNPPGFTINFSDPFKSKLAPSTDFSQTTLYKIDSFNINLENYDVSFKDPDSPLFNLGGPEIERASTMFKYGSSPVNIPDIYKPISIDGVSDDYQTYTYTTDQGSIFDDGLGGLFHSSGQHYSNSFRNINAPTLDHIVEKGNMAPKWGGTPGTGYKTGPHTESPSALVAKLRTSETAGRPPGYNDTGNDNINQVSQWPINGQNELYLPTLSNYVTTSTNGAGEPIYQGTTGKRTVDISLGDITGDTLSSMNQHSHLYNDDQTVTGNKKLQMPGQDLSIKQEGRNPGPRGAEPYIVYDRGDDIGGGRSWPFNHMLKDVERIAKYMITRKGIEFIAKQNLLGAIARPNPLIQPDVKKGFLGKKIAVGGKEKFKFVPLGQKYMPFYNPLSTLANIAMHGVVGYAMPFGTTLQRDWPVMPPWPGTYGSGMRRGIGTYTKYMNDKNVTIHDDKFTYRNQNTNKAANTMGAIDASDNVNESMNPKKQRGALAGFGDVMTTMPIKQLDSNQNNSAHQELEKQAHGMPFYFKDMRTAELIVFRGFISGLIETVTPEWNEETYVGRSEPVYVYKSGIREITFRFTMAAQTRYELNSMYKKLQRLTSLAYPQYIADSSFLTSKMRMRPPLTKLRIGELYGGSDISVKYEEVEDPSTGEVKTVMKNEWTGRELGGILMGLSYEFPDNSPWEIKMGRRVPKIVSCDITYRVIHDVTPGNTTEFYGFSGYSQADTLKAGTRSGQVYYNEDGTPVAEPDLWGW